MLRKNSRKKQECSHHTDLTMQKQFSSQTDPNTKAVTEAGENSLKN